MTTVPVPQESQVEQRVAMLEQQMAGVLRTLAIQKDTPGKSWETTMGMWKDDEFSREADRLGEEWRQSVTD
jgi:hypothetical protein